MVHLSYNKTDNPFPSIDIHSLVYAYKFTDIEYYKGKLTSKRVCTSVTDIMVLQVLYSKQVLTSKLLPGVMVPSLPVQQVFNFLPSHCSHSLRMDRQLLLQNMVYLR